MSFGSCLRWPDDGCRVRLRELDMCLVTWSESRLYVLQALIAQNPFSILFPSGKSGLDANPLPFELNVSEGEVGVLHAHVACANQIGKQPCQRTLAGLSIYF